MSTVNGRLQSTPQFSGPPGMVPFRCQPAPDSSLQREPPHRHVESYSCAACGPWAARRLTCADSWFTRADSWFTRLEYIAKDFPSYAATLAARARVAADSLTDLPDRGHRVREYQDPNIRELIVGRSYRLIYKVTETSVTITSVVHVARDLESLLDRP